MSIQLVSRARRAGLLITPRAVFQHQSVAALAAVAGVVEETAAGRRTLPPGHCRRRRSCAGSSSAAVRSIASTRRCCCGCRRGCGRMTSSAPCRRCSIITMRCGCGLLVPHRVVSSRWRSRLPATVDGAGLPAAGGCRRPRRGCAARLHHRAGAGGGDAACAGGRRDGAGGVVRRRGGRGRPPAADDPSPGGGRGVVADPGARPCGRVGGDRGRQEARAGGVRNVVAGLGAAAGGGSPGGQAGRGAFVLARDAERAVAVAGRWRARCRRATPSGQPGS